MALVSRVLILAVLMVALLLSSRPVSVTSQPTGQLQPHFNQAIIQVHKAESAGATTNEVAKLAVLLNKALELNEQALALTRPEDALKRAQLLAQVDEMLDSVQSNATQLEAVASQRTFINSLVAYVSGGVAAFIATLAYAFGTSLWRRYRVKRTFQMKVIPK
jgi:glycerol-3-phosphate O-acyltransferase